MILKKRFSLKQMVKTVIFRALPNSYVLMFHHITDTPKLQKSGCLLDFERFKKIVLRYQGNYEHLIDVVEKKCKRKLAITFDDGLVDLYEMAYPFLKEYNIPFTAFIVTDFLDTEGYITTEQLKEMSADPLVTIGSHGVTHDVFPKLKLTEKQYELKESKRILQTIIEQPVRFFAYSHGQFDDETLSLMEDYDYAVSAGISVSVCLKNNKYVIPRVNITSELYEQQILFLDNVITMPSNK